ncbi:hypothetical protein GJ496_004361 [Pomphorhynchus laevis]|nr:hypothetical protein GJ496_004361 [Pomphorhynchus laevis]
MSFSHCQCQNHCKMVPISLTFVQYIEDDIFGKLFAMMSLLPILGIFTIFTVVCLRRDLKTIWLFFGCLLSEILNFILKRIFRADRPRSELSVPGQYHRYGMPSDHSQMAAFISIYMAFVVMKSRLFGRQSIFKRLFCTIIIISIGCLISFSRIYLCYHSLAQMMVGYGVGCIFAILWFNAFMKYIYLASKSIINHWVSRYFMIRDYSNIPDILERQYHWEIESALKHTD